MGKRGHRGRKLGKNERERLALQALSGQIAPWQTANASDQEQNPADAQDEYSLEAEHSRTQVETQAATALVDDLDEAKELDIYPSVEPTFGEESAPGRPMTPMEVNDDGEEEEMDDESEMSWSRSPSAHFNPPPPPPPAQSGPLPPVQPYGDYCFVLCRLSSMKKVPDKTLSDAQRTQAYKQRRIDEGLTLADRLAANCPTPVTFAEKWSYCGVRHSADITDWSKRPSSSSAWVNDIRGYLLKCRNKKVTILIRAVDGLTTNHTALQSFAKWLKVNKISAQLIFQWNKVCDEIRPTPLRNFKGLGGTADFMAADILAHMEKTALLPEVQRLLDILVAVESSKGVQQGIQDRNALPHANLKQAEEVAGVANSAGRRRAMA
ncbi:hypothetical protein DE146DRAFT_761544 [Phaeosphaeria sp. MPI-PUGE-AT-0046c]|nr:hypothetical protein DE146DRAFT_761544 [Phaeosphaeria sp. MPI-PUGE-AT-0046c]